MKKLLVSVLLIAIGCVAFANNFSAGVYVSPISFQSSKGLVDESKANSVYGFGIKGDLKYTIPTSGLNWTAGAELDINDYFYSGKRNNNDFAVEIFATGGINLIDSTKGIVGFGFGLGPIINISGGKSSSRLGLMIREVNILHLYSNISVAFQLEGVVGFMETSKSLFEFKTFFGLNYSF